MVANSHESDWKDLIKTNRASHGTINKCFWCALLCARIWGEFCTLVTNPFEVTFVLIEISHQNGNFEGENIKPSVMCARITRPRHRWIVCLVTLFVYLLLMGTVFFLVQSFKGGWVPCACIFPRARGVLLFEWWTQICKASGWLPTKIEIIRWIVPAVAVFRVRVRGTFCVTDHLREFVVRKSAWPH